MVLYKQGNFPVTESFPLVSYLLAFIGNWLSPVAYLTLDFLPSSSLFPHLDKSWGKLMDSDFFLNFSRAMVTSRLWFHSIACLPLGFMTFSSVSFGWLCSHLSISRAFIHFLNKHSILLMHFLSTLFFAIVLTSTRIPFQLHNSKAVCRPHYHSPWDLWGACCCCCRLFIRPLS